MKKFIPGYFLIIFVFVVGSATKAQKAPVSNRDTLDIPKPVFDSSGNLQIIASSTSSSHDFDFLVGKWTMHNKKLKTRLNNCTEWTEFESTDENHHILLGAGNTDIYTSNVNGTPFEGLTVRLFNPKTRLWSLYWVASNVGVMDPPVVGSFEGNVGTFICKDSYQGKPVIVMFRWVKTDKDNPIWWQAFSPDNGLSWEWNSTNVSHRVK